jgi:hypothetical protein
MKSLQRQTKHGNNQKETIISQLVIKKQESIKSLTASLAATIDLKMPLKKATE